MRVNAWDISAEARYRPVQVLSKVLPGEPRVKASHFEIVSNLHQAGGEVVISHVRGLSGC